MPRRRPASCPRCGSTDTIPIAYGLPGPELMEAAERGEVAIGGCIVSGSQPTHECRGCGRPFRRVR